MAYGMAWDQAVALAADAAADDDDDWTYRPVLGHFGRLAFVAIYDELGEFVAFLGHDSIESARIARQLTAYGEWPVPAVGPAPLSPVARLAATRAVAS